MIVLSEETAGELTYAYCDLCGSLEELGEAYGRVASAIMDNMRTRIIGKLLFTLGLCIHYDSKVKTSNFLCRWYWRRKQRNAEKRRGYLHNILKKLNGC